MKYNGLNRDVSNTDMPEGFGIDAKNGINSKYKGASINEDGFKVFQKSNASASKKYGLPFTISGVSYIRHWLGEININENQVVVFSIGYKESCGTFATPTTSRIFSEIGLLSEDGEYTTVINDLSFTSVNKLNFNPVYPYTGEYTINYLGEVIVAATDNNNSPLYININYFITNPPTASFDINSIKMFPDINHLNVGVQVKDYGGSLPNGTYYLSFKYENEDLSSTNSVLSATPVYIFNTSVGNSVSSFKQVEGDLELNNTAKLMQVTVLGVNTAFSKLGVYAIVKRNGQSFPYFIKSVDITSSTISFEVDSVQDSNISLQELLTPSATFKKVYKFTQVYNRLYCLRPTYTQLRNFQKWANNIKVGWVSKLVEPSIDTPAKTESNRDEKTFLHKEVYALNIHLTLTDGTVTEGFPITWNHIAKDADITAAGYRANSTLAANQGITCKVFQMEDTCQVGVSTNPNPTGFWENQDETYPNTSDFDIWGLVSGTETNLSALATSNPNYKETLKNKKVRHHRFPSIAYLKDVLYSSEDAYGLSKLDKLGLDIRNVYIPNEIRPFVKGWFISYCQRDYNNSTVIGQSVIGFETTATDTYSGTKKYPDVWYSGLNKLLKTYVGGSGTFFNVMPVTPYIVNRHSYNIKETIWRFYDLNILKNQPDISPTYVSNELFLEAKYDYFNVVNCNGTKTDNGNNAASFAVDFTGALSSKVIGTDIKAYTTDDISNVNVRYRKVSNYKYLSERVIDDRYDNQTLEDCLILELDSDTLSGSITEGIRSVPVNVDMSLNTFDPTELNWGEKSTSWDGLKEQSYLSTLMALPSNVYSKLQNQKVVNTGLYYDVLDNNTGELYAGDGVISNYGYHTGGWGACRSQQLFVEGDGFKGIRTNRFHIHSGIDNCALRSNDSTKPHLKSAPKYPVDYINDINRDEITSNNLYNNDYSSINNIISLAVYDWNRVYNLTSLYRVNRCVERDNETAYTGWRTWLTNDYYETVRNKGLPINIEGIDRDLLIQHEQATFITVGNEQLDINESSAFIGVGNIFDRNAIELLPSKDGSIGGTHMFGTNLNMYGYVSIDFNKRKILLLRNKSNPLLISNVGMARWFWDNLKYDNKLYYNSTSYIEIPDDNPYNGFGFNICYDPQYERLIISKKLYELTNSGKLAVTIGILRYIENRWILTNPDASLSEVSWDNTSYFVNKGFTVSFDLASNVFTFFHDYFPDRLFNNRLHFFAVKKKALASGKSNTSRVFFGNSGHKGVYDNTSIIDVDGSQTQSATPFAFYIAPIFNGGLGEKKFFNTQWITEVYNNNNFLLRDKTFTSLLAFNQHQCTGNKTLVPFDFDNYFNSNIRLIKSHWNFNTLRDMLRLDISTNPNPPVPFIVNYSELNEAITPIDLTKEIQTQRPFISNWLCIKYIYNNEIVDNYSKEFRILATVSEFLPTER
jgi:hypothetical protein